MTEAVHLDPRVYNRVIASAAPRYVIFGPGDTKPKGPGNVIDSVDGEVWRGPATTEVVIGANTNDVESDSE